MHLQQYLIQVSTLRYVMDHECIAYQLGCQEYRAQQDLILKLANLALVERSGRHTFPININAVQVVRLDKRNDVGNEGILVAGLDCIAEDGVGSWFCGEQPASK